MKIVGMRQGPMAYEKKPLVLELLASPPQPYEYNYSMLPSNSYHAHIYKKTKKVSTIKISYLDGGK